MRGKRLLTAALILFAVPIGAGAALGHEMSENRIASIPAAVVDHDNSEFSRLLVGLIDENDIFDVTVHAASDSEVERLIFEGKAFVGVIIPEGMQAGLRSGAMPEVAVVYDGSYMIVAAGARAAMAEILQTVKAGFTTRSIEPVFRILYNPSRNYRNFFLPGLITAIIQVGIVIVGLERAKEEDTRFTSDLSKILVTGLVGLLAIAVSMAVQHAFYGMPFRGDVAAFAVLTLQFSLCMAAFGYMFGKAIPDKVLSTQLACLFVLPAAILGGYTFPLMAMPDFFRRLSMAIPLSYYGESLRNLTLKEVGMAHFTSDMLYFSVFLCAELAVVFALAAVRGRRLADA